MFVFYAVKNLDFNLLVCKTARLILGFLKPATKQDMNLKNSYMSFQRLLTGLDDTCRFIRVFVLEVSEST